MSGSSSLPPEIEYKLNQLQSRIQQAAALEQARRVDEAQAAYHACLQMAARERIPILGEHLVQIWMGLGFCYADRNDWRRALEWYHRAEAVILSAPMFNPNPESPEAQAHAKRWAAHLPQGVHVMLRDYQSEAYLAILCDSIAWAYDNDNQLEYAREYYQRAADLYIKLDNPVCEAKVWWHQAIGCRRREEWFNLEVVAGKMYFAATQTQDKPIMLIALRFLGLSQINQKRFFKAMEHLGQIVLLGRELEDAGLAEDEKLLRDYIRDIRPCVLRHSRVDALAALVRVESIVNDPNLAQDEALLRKWQKEQPNIPRASLMPVGYLDSLSTAAMVLEYFASRHCGASIQTEKRDKKGLMGMLGGTEMARRRVWEITQEEMPLYKKNEQGQLVQYVAPSMVLTFFGQPEAIIAVSLTGSECCVMVMEERPLPGVSETGYFSTAQECIPPQSEALLSCLNTFILRGLFVKTDKGLQYVSPKRP